MVNEGNNYNQVIMIMVNKVIVDGDVYNVSPNLKNGLCYISIYKF